MKYKLSPEQRRLKRIADIFGLFYIPGVIVYLVFIFLIAAPVILLFNIKHKIKL
jgi:hypothetical protein